MELIEIAQVEIEELQDDLTKLDINKICTRNGPTLLDIRIDANEVPPIATRLKGMK